MTLFRGQGQREEKAEASELLEKTLNHLPVLELVAFAAVAVDSEASVVVVVAGLVVAAGSAPAALGPVAAGPAGAADLGLAADQLAPVEASVVVVVAAAVVAAVVLVEIGRAHV